MDRDSLCGTVSGWMVVSDSTMANVYCAGPLFSESERREMDMIARVLKDADQETFLPHRDGLELTKLTKTSLALDSDRTTCAIDSAVFHLDIYKLLSWSDAVVANLNGRTPDEGTVVEAALAWHSGKALVLFKNDDRCVYAVCSTY